MAWLQREFGPTLGAVIIAPAAPSVRRVLTRASCLIFCLRPARSARAIGRWRPVAARPAEPAGRDHRPDRPQDDDQRPQFGRRRSSWPTSRTPTRRPGRTWSRGPDQPDRRGRADASRFENPDGKTYRLNEQTATLLVRPRGWHLAERHVLVDGEPISPACSTSACTSSTTRGELLERGQRPVLLPAQARRPPRSAALERRLQSAPRTRSASRAARSGPRC